MEGRRESRAETREAEGGGRREGEEREKREEREGRGGKGGREGEETKEKRGGESER